MEAIEVTARWDAQGGVLPLDFAWRGGAYRVASVGRRWQDEAGLHLLVMDLGGRVFELIFDPARLVWLLAPRLAGPETA